MQRDSSVTAVEWWRRKWEKRQWERWWLKRKACTSEGRREVRPEQESRSDMRHNASVRQMTMPTTSSPNKLQPRAPALRQPWGVIVPVAPLTDGRRGNMCMETGWAGEQQEKKAETKKASRLTSITGRFIFLRPLRGELGVDWNCMCFAGKGSPGSRCRCGCSPPKPILYWVRYSDAAFGSSSSGQGGGMTLVWIFWRAASKTSQGVVLLLLLLLLL